MAPMGHNGVMMTQQPVMDMSQHMIPTPPSSSHEDVETKTESSSQNSKDRRTPYVPVTSGGAAVSGSLTQGSSSASSYKGAATSGSTGGSSMSSRDGASRDRSVKVMMLTQSCITDVLRIIYTLPCSIMFVCSNSLISLPLFRQFFFVHCILPCNIRTGQHQVRDKAVVLEKTLPEVQQKVARKQGQPPVPRHNGLP